MSTGLILYIATAVFFAGLGIVYSRHKKFSATAFISSKNSYGLGASVATIFASGMGAWILFGPAETFVTSGFIALLGYGLSSAFSLWVFIWLGRKIRTLLPKGHTLTEYVLQRFGKLMYVLVLAVSAFYMSLALTAELTGIALAGKVVFGIPAYVSALVVGVGVTLYTWIGGFRASVFTDRVQTWFILPLFALLFVGTLIFVGGFNLESGGRELFQFSFGGMEFGVTLIIAIVSAELFNQSWWQRVYAAKNERIMKKSFFVSGLMVLPIIILAGLFGMFALGTPAAADPSVALFSFLLTLPSWILIVGMVLAVALIMSSADTLLNALVSIFTVDLIRLKPNMKKQKLLTIAKVITLVISVVAIGIAIKGMSVLYLFLLADLVTVALVFPVFYGMFQSRLSGRLALVAGIAGLIVGFSLFPDPNFTRGNLLWSFSLAFTVPFLLCLFFSRSDNFDFSRLKSSGSNLEVADN